jgi:hypothetical protein
VTFDRRHVLAQWGGTLPGGEIWSNSLRLASSTTGDTASVPTEPDMIAWLEGSAQAAVAAYHSGTTAQIHQAAKLTFLKLNVVDLNGRYVQQNTLEHVYSPVVSGGGATTLYPNQVALVISTTTDFQRGLAHRGRYYMPLPVFPLDPISGLISQTNADFAAGAAATFIDALADQPGPDLPDMRVCVMSAKGTGATNVVTGVDVGRALDTQRRRRVELAESYAHAVIVQ